MTDRTFEDIVAHVLLDSGFESDTDTYGLDFLLICELDGTTIEQDCPACPECGRPNPLIAQGLI
jgi:hypothetical protein